MIWANLKESYCNTKPIMFFHYKHYQDLVILWNTHWVMMLMSLCFQSVRNAVAMFLTRGDLWLHWEKGADHMMEHLVDCDWSVNAGNWMWVSSSAFERLLDCSVCINSVSYGKRLEPSGDFIRRYVPELANFPFEYIHEPWKAPIEAQETAKCFIGTFKIDVLVKPNCDLMDLIAICSKESWKMSNKNDTALSYELHQLWLVLPSRINMTITAELEVISARYTVFDFEF